MSWAPMPLVGAVVEAPEGVSGGWWGCCCDTAGIVENWSIWKEALPLLRKGREGMQGVLAIQFDGPCRSLHKQSWANHHAPSLPKKCCANCSCLTRGFQGALSPKNLQCKCSASKDLGRKCLNKEQVFSLLVYLAHSAASRATVCQAGAGISYKNLKRKRRMKEKLKLKLVDPMLQTETVPRDVPDPYDIISFHDTIHFLGFDISGQKLRKSRVNTYWVLQTRVAVPSSTYLDQVEVLVVQFYHLQWDGYSWTRPIRQYFNEHIVAIRSLFISVPSWKFWMQPNRFNIYMKSFYTNHSTNWPPATSKA